MPSLPITRVVLYKHGVGYFEHEGGVEGDASLTLTFKQGEVSDVLKSLTVLDLDGGHVAAVSYDSTKPLEQLLAEIALSIPDRDALAGLLPQLKGARVSVRQPPADEVTEGTLLGIDVAEVQAEGGIAKEPLVSVLTDAGEVRAFDLYDSGLQLLDAGLRRDLEFYLRTQLSAKKKDARTFTLFARGSGKRRVRMSYVLEAPVWKATYRILLGEEGKEPLIQGWAVVDNMQDDDWEGIELTLVAGLPVSFVHDLYTPRYIRRPVVAVQETTGVLPPGVEAGTESLDSMMMELTDTAIDATQAEAGGGPAAKTWGGKRMAAQAPRSAISSAPAQVRERQVGDLFEYAIDHPVTIRRNQSALVPIVLKPFNGRSVLLYQKAARAENPLRCVEFENTTGLTLEGGPVTVLEAGSYVGEAMLDTMKPNEHRLIGYAVELGVRVFDNIESHDQRAHRVVIRNGLLTSYYQRIIQTTYTFRSNSARDETVYLDHPRQRSEMELFDTPAPQETTEHYWRFKFALPARQTVRFVVKQRDTLQNAFALADPRSNVLNYWLEEGRHLDPATDRVLREIRDLQRQATDLEGRIARLNQEREQIHAEQKRIRENLQSLGDRTSEKELRERFVRTLNAQEDRLEQIDREGKQLLAERDAARAKIAEVLAKLDYEGAVG